MVQHAPQIAYTVVATLPDADTAEAYIAWLVGGHISDVIAGGALSGHIVRLDPPGDSPQTPRVEVHYRFPDRATFDRYEREHAPALRDEGLARFGPDRLGPDRAVRFERRLGEVIAALP